MELRVLWDQTIYLKGTAIPFTKQTEIGSKLRLWNEMTCILVAQETEKL